MREGFDIQKRTYLDAVMKRKNDEGQRLSAREKEVLRLLADGNAPSEIAQPADVMPVRCAS